MFFSTNTVRLISGYVLSREALNRFVKRALSDKSGIFCKTKEDTGTLESGNFFVGQHL